MPERLRRTWNGHVKSTAGWRAWPAGRSWFWYADELGRLQISAEWLKGRPGAEYVIYILSIPDLPSRPRSLVVKRLASAAEFARWKLEMDDVAPG